MGAGANPQKLSVFHYGYLTANVSSNFSIICKYTLLRACCILVVLLTYALRVEGKKDLRTVSLAKARFPWAIWLWRRLCLVPFVNDGDAHNSQL